MVQVPFRTSMKTFFSQRRNMIGTAIVGALVLGALGVGILYLVVFPGSSPQKLTLSSPAPSTSASAASSDPAVAAPSDAVGRTSAITGTLTITQAAGSYTLTAADFTVDVSTLTSDQSRRDQRIHSQGLESSRYPTATFKLTSPITLPAEAGSGQTIHVTATGALTIHGVTKTVTIPIDARLTGSKIELVGSITFPFSQFGMTPPSIGGFVTVQNNATMEFQLMLSRQGA